MRTKYENFKTVPLEFYFLAGMKVLLDSAMESMAALISFGRCTLVYVKLAGMVSQISLYSFNGTTSGRLLFIFGLFTKQFINTN